MSVSDRILRGLGADPAVYHPIARAQSRLLDRRAPGMRRSARGVTLKGIMPFHFKCFSFALISFFMMQLILGAKSPVFGAAMALTGSAILLLMDLLLDKFDMLTNPDEYQVIAAHPHDAWSVILAKLVVIGRSVAILAACLFALPAVGAGLAFHSAEAGAAFVMGAAALTVFISAGGMLLSAVLVAAGGRRVLMNLMPIFHFSLMGLYLGAYFSREALMRAPVPRLESLGWLQWALPPIWFAAPVEAVTGRAGPAAIARGSLALGSLTVMLPLTARWIQARFDERILEPVQRARRVPVVRVDAERADGRVTRVSSDWMIGVRVFWRLFLAHMKSDTAVRAGIMTAFFIPFMSAGPLLFSAHGAAVPFENVMVGILMALTAAGTFLIRSVMMSTRPTAIWFVMTAPRARISYAAAVTRVIRFGIVLPVVAAAGIYAAGAGTGSPLIRAELVILTALLADSTMVVLRAMSPYLPFSQPVRTKRPFSWSSLIIGAMTLAALTLFIGGFLALQHFYPAACFIPVVYAAAARWPLGIWAKRRVERESLRAEPM